MMTRVTPKPQQIRAITNVNKLGNVYIRSVILIELVVLRENRWTKTITMLNFCFSSVREQSRYIHSMVQNFALN